MKKIFFLSVFALGLMTSCSKDDLTSAPSYDNNAIAFATKSAYKAITRSGATINSIDKFTVSAVDESETPFFSGVEFSYNTAKGVFNSNTPYYWPLSGSLNFYAISNPGTVSLDAHNTPKYSYENWGGETDLVAATVLSGEKQIPYPLVFQHVLSQVYVSAEAKNKTEQLTYKLTSVEMTTPCNGTYSFANATAGIGTWEIDNNTGKEYSFADALPLSFTQTGSVSTSTTYWNILPVTDGKIQFRVGYQVFQNGQMIAEFSGANAKTCEVITPNLVSGKRYVYNFLLTRGTEDAITFTMSMADWDGNATVTDLEPLDPTLTYVTYRNGTTKSFDIEGDIHSNTSNSVSPSEMIDDLVNATYVKLGNKVTSIGYKAFAGCSYISKIDIPSSVQSLGEDAFAHCFALTEITLPEGITELPHGLFCLPSGYSGTGGISKINLPSTLTKIGGSVFFGCHGLRSIDIPASVTEIGKWAFANTNIEEVTFHGPVNMGDMAFSACNYLERVSIPAGSVLGTNCFRQNISRYSGDEVTSCLKEVTFEGKVTLNGYAQFWGCVNLERINYLSTELPEFKLDVITDDTNAWTSTTAHCAMGYNTREAGTNLFCVPANATYTEDDLDVCIPVVFNSEYCGFTLSKTL